LEAHEIGGFARAVSPVKPETSGALEAYEIGGFARAVSPVKPETSGALEAHEIGGFANPRSPVNPETSEVSTAPLKLKASYSLLAMSRRIRLLLIGAATAWVAVLAGLLGAQRPSTQLPDAATPPAVTIDYPLEGSVFPPDFTAPTFLWRDPTPSATAWAIDVDFGDGRAEIHAQSAGAPPHVGAIDRRAVSETNRLPELTPEMAAAHSWTPDSNTWSVIKKRSVERAAVVTITGMAGTPARPVSRGRVTIRTSKDPVGAPIFYRDVPLMASESEKGVIKPLASEFIPLIAWRLRYVGEPQSRLVLEGLHTCTNCHSFSRDGKTLGMDVDGPQNDKGTYAIASVSPRMSIRNEDVITWNAYPDKPAGSHTIGFLSQVSPDGRYAVTTLNEEVYVANFKDYRFLQVFYPTRGILALYDRTTREMKALPGADDPRYVHTDGVWSPDGKYLVFARALARDAYPPGRKLAEYAGDPNEVPNQYDLYRIPFNGGAGGRPEPIAGASGNGMSNSFPKISPDGRWLVFVKCRNGQLMRPDGELYIVPAGGGEARRLGANTSLMNSWHSFSPNGRWLVFSSKSRSPYTQMFLTHLDEAGKDSPAILIENSTAANRAVNIPEFVNLPPDGLLHIDVPAAEFYRLFDSAVDLERAGKHAEAVAEWTRALAMDGENAKARTHFGIALLNAGASGEAVAQFRKAVELNPAFLEAHNNLGVALVQLGRFEEAIAHFKLVVDANPDVPQSLANLGSALVAAGRAGEAIPYLERLVEANPRSADVHETLGRALAAVRRFDEAIAHLRQAVAIDPRNAEARFNLGDTLYSQGQTADALAEWRAGLQVEPDNVAVLSLAAWTLATSPDAAIRNGAEAVALAERAMRVTGGREPAVFDALAAAYAEAGRFPDAVKTAQSGIALATPATDARVVEGLKAHAALYAKGMPYRGK
jgi:tetratricopeptide (TPR) repeat protein